MFGINACLRDSWRPAGHHAAPWSCSADTLDKHQEVTIVSYFMSEQHLEIQPDHRDNPVEPQAVFRRSCIIKPMVFLSRHPRVVLYPAEQEDGTLTLNAFMLEWK